MDDMFRNVNHVCDSNGIETVPVLAGETIDGLVTERVEFLLGFAKSFEENKNRINDYREKLTRAIVDNSVDGKLYIRDCGEIKSRKGVSSWIEVLTKEKDE